MNRILKHVLLVSGIFLFGLLRTQAQDEKLKAIFVYNFTRYLAWPEKQGDFVIAVLGKTPIYSELSDIASKKQVGTTNIEVRSVGSAQDITDCHILYVTSAKTDMIADIQPAARNKKFLIISENEGACSKGSGINFINKAGKLSFEISKNNISACGLTLSSALLQLGTEAK
ncbi:MAG TPA: YfiR family protein [Bacteroidales bacterium]|jgi:hypothetical protein|nr:YfiR family protein [Bacteroidales bacterium]